MLFTFSLYYIVVYFILIFSGSISVYNQNGSRVLILIGVLNIYVWFLQYMYSPSSEGVKEQKEMEMIEKKRPSYSYDVLDDSNHEIQVEFQAANLNNQQQHEENYEYNFNLGEDHSQNQQHNYGSPKEISNIDKARLQHAISFHDQQYGIDGDDKNINVDQIYIDQNEDGTHQGDHTDKSHEVKLGDDDDDEEFQH